MSTTRQGLPEFLSPLLSQYPIADEDSKGAVKYFGFLDQLGNWLILKQDTSTATYTYRYANLSNNSAVTGYHAGATQAWSNRATLTYDYVDVLKGI